MASSDLIYRKLQKHLDTLPIGFPPTKSGVELRLLRHFFNEDEAQIALCLGFQPKPIQILYQRIQKKTDLKISMAQLEEALDKMYLKGSINRTKPKGIKHYAAAFLVIGMFEFQVDHMDKEFVNDMHEYLYHEFSEEIFHTKFPQLRTSPIPKAITPEHRIAIYDDMKTIIQNYKGTIVAMNCICKQAQDLLGQPCHQTKERQICLSFGGPAKGYLERKQGKQITNEETLQLLELAEKDGLVLQPANSLEPFCLCLCCGDCCGVLTAAKKFPDPAHYLASNYFAELNTNKCTGCGVCLKRCQMDAISPSTGKKQINLDKCIGCGLCVPTCPTKAIQLRKKEHETVPPQNAMQLYMKILEQKAGKKVRYLLMLKNLFGMQI